MRPNPFSLLSSLGFAQHGDHSMQMGTSGLAALSRLSGNAFDVAFLSQMIPHHRAAIEMARAALPTLKNPAVRRHAQQIVASQTQEIRKMTDLLQRTYRTKPSPEQARLMQADMKSMMAMKPVGDRAFLEMMTPHHQGAIDMSGLALKKTNSAAIKSLAGQIQREQRGEITEFQRLLQNL